MTSTFSSVDDPRQDDVGDNAPSTSRHRSVQSEGGLCRSDVKDVLFDQRVLFEMRLRTVKLEILKHVTEEFAILHDFMDHWCRPYLPLRMISTPILYRHHFHLEVHVELVQTLQILSMHVLYIFQ